MNTIVYKNVTFTDTNIEGGSIIRTKSAIGDELAFDTFDVVLNSITQPDELFDSLGILLADVNDNVLTASPSSMEVDLKTYTKGSPALLYQDNVLIGKFYIDSVTRVGKNSYKLHFVSALGLLDDIPHKGGIYSSVNAGTIISSILGGTYVSETSDYEYYNGIIPYYLEKRVKNTIVNGWLPYSSSSRANLQQVLFAVGASITKDANGTLMISYWQPTQAIDLPSTRIYNGGSFQYQSKPTKVVVAEHSYIQSSLDTDVELFSTGNGIVTNTMVLFENPCYDLDFGTLTQIESGVNYAIVSGSGTLTGKPYTHAINTIEKSTGVTGVESIKSVKNAYLVSATNSINVAERVASYYTDAEFVNYNFKVLGDVEVGDRVRFTDPFGEETTAYLLDEDITLSGIMKASAKFIANWQPNHVGNAFNNYVILDAVGEKFTPTAALVGTPARIICFGGFQGGSGSYAGSSGTSATREAMGTGGEGGEGGEGGYQVKMYQVDITLANQDYTVTQIGTGGMGGNAQDGDTEPTAGVIGGDTVCAGYSSADGSILSSGYANPLTGEIYGAKAISGIKGSSGGAGWQVGNDATFRSVQSSGGQTGSYAECYDEDWYISAYGYGGGGGGATGLTNGGRGGDARAWRQGYTNVLYCGNGGVGATQTAYSQATFGQCGMGACGGGGGGGGANGWAYGVGAWVTWGTGGAGGAGQQGQQGSNGFVLILYN